MLDPVLINILVDNRRTSIKLEQPMWDAIDEICRIERMTRKNLAFSGRVKLAGREAALAPLQRSL